MLLALPPGIAMGGAGFEYKLIRSADPAFEANVPDAMVAGLDGNLYMAIAHGSPDARGVVMKMTPRGKATMLFQFSDASLAGTNPVNLALGPDGQFYGATTKLGPGSHGSIFRISEKGRLAVVYNFQVGGEETPVSDMAFDGSSLFYVMAPFGETFYRTTTRGKTTELETNVEIGHFFGSSGLCRGVDGDFYGTTREGAQNGAGSVYGVDPLTGSARTIHAFGLGDPSGYPGSAAYVSCGPDGMLYVVTTGGGTNDMGAISKMSLDGSTVAVLHDFSADDAFGNAPQGPLLIASDGYLYGITGAGGAGAGSGAHGGVVYRLRTDGQMKVVHDFGLPHPERGDQPYGRLTELADGSLYGTTLRGGTFSIGAYFRLQPKSPARGPDTDERE